MNNGDQIGLHVVNYVQFFFPLLIFFIFLLYLLMYFVVVAIVVVVVLLVLSCGLDTGGLLQSMAPIRRWRRINKRQVGRSAEAGEITSRASVDAAFAVQCVLAVALHFDRVHVAAE